VELFKRDSYGVEVRLAIFGRGDFLGEANFRLGLLDPAIRDAIVLACREIRFGKYHNHFVVDMIQGGAGTSTNMNANEERCRELVQNSIGIITALVPYIAYQDLNSIARDALALNLSG